MSSHGRDLKDLDRFNAANSLSWLLSDFGINGDYPWDDWFDFLECLP